MTRWVIALVLAVSAAGQVRAAPVLAKPQFEQVALTVRDLDTARAFYRDRLGLTLMFEAGGMLFFDVDGTRLMLAHDPDRVSPARPGGILYFHVDDFTAALSRLRAANTPLVGQVETVDSTRDGYLRLQQFTDPDGNMLAIMGFVRR